MMSTLESDSSLPTRELKTFFFNSLTFRPLNLNRLMVNSSALGMFIEADIPGMLRGGKREAPRPSLGVSGSAREVHAPVQLWRIVIKAAISAILCVKEMLTAVPPQPNEVNRTRSKEPLVSLWSWEEGRKCWRESRFGWWRKSERWVSV